jgi:predicted glycosyltransferase
MPRKAFVSILNLGLGHATRSIPIIRRLYREGWEVIIGSNGRALALLRKEFPDAGMVTTPDYQLRYAKNDWTAVKLALQTPRLLAGIHAERQFCKRVVEAFQPDVIISDQCYGMYHPAVYSVLITHQLYFEPPKWARFLRSSIGLVNQQLYQAFNQILIPDYRSGAEGMLSGRLSELPSLNPVKYHHVGILSSVKKMSLPEDIDVFISISGPEPQRTLFEQKVLTALSKLRGKIVVVLGKSESDWQQKKDNITVFSHLPRQQMGEMMNRAKIIVCRSGYSTIMELAELGKKALLVPTPGQTEQLYLAEHLHQKGWYWTVPQHNLNIAEDIRKAADRPGLFMPDVTAKTVQHIYSQIILPNFSFSSNKVQKATGETI